MKTTLFNGRLISSTNIYGRVRTGRVVRRRTYQLSDVLFDLCRDAVRPAVFQPMQMQQTKTELCFASAVSRLCASLGAA